jgi:Ala-tRNA(Pro) deacylase
MPFWSSQVSEFRSSHFPSLHNCSVMWAADICSGPSSGWHPGKEVAKTVVLRAGEKTLLAVLPASLQVNLNKLASIMGSDVRLATESECIALFPDCEPGAVPPFGELYGLPVYLDEALAEDPEIVFSAGTHSDAVGMSNADSVHLAKPQICSFADEESGSISSVIPTDTTRRRIMTNLACTPCPAWSGPTKRAVECAGQCASDHC